MKKMLDTR